MTKSLIAIAIAGSLATGIAGAQGMTLHTPDHDRIVAPTHVQYDNRGWHTARSSPVIDDREARLQERIQRGLESGRLTRQEAWRLSRRLENIQAREREFMSDGRLARWEERELMRDLDQLANNMRVQLRDEDRRY